MNVNGQPTRVSYFYEGRGTVVLLSAAIKRLQIKRQLQRLHYQYEIAQQIGGYNPVAFLKSTWFRLWCVEFREVRIVIRASDSKSSSNAHTIHSTYIHMYLCSQNITSVERETPSGLCEIPLVIRLQLSVFSSLHNHPPPPPNTPRRKIKPDHEATWTVGYSHNLSSEWPNDVMRSRAEGCCDLQQYNMHDWQRRFSERKKKKKRFSALLAQRDTNVYNNTSQINENLFLSASARNTRSQKVGFLLPDI